MTLSSMWEITTKIIDIGVVWLAFYYILKNIKNNIKNHVFSSKMSLALSINFAPCLIN